MPKKRVVKCPHFKKLKRSTSIMCENVCSNLGFEVSTSLDFEMQGERTHFFELFCCDLYINCPYYKVLKESK